jgi:hypothetical protein
LFCLIDATFGRGALLGLARRGEQRHRQNEREGA